jgi:hypothetical protein
LVDLEKYTVKDKKSSTGILCKGKKLRTGIRYLCIKDILDLSIILTVCIIYVQKLKRKILYGAYGYILDLSTQKKGNAKDNKKLFRQKKIM